MADERTVWGRSVEAIGMYYIFFFNDTATTEIYTLSLHDALPIFYALATIAFQALTGTLPRAGKTVVAVLSQARREPPPDLDRKSTRLNSSHANISYAVFCLKKKKLHLFHPLHHFAFPAHSVLSSF